jgi:hypothetical protein
LLFRLSRSNAQTIKITLAAPAILDFRRVAVKTPTAPEISVYPVLHGTSQTPVAVQPVFPLQLFEGEVVSSSTGNNGTYYALLNPSASSVNVTEDVSTLAANYSTQTTETQFMLGPGEVKTKPLTSRKVVKLGCSVTDGVAPGFAVRIVVVDLALALRVFCPLNSQCDSAIGSKFPARILLPGCEPLALLV